MTLVFHQLDVVDPASIASLADFVKTQFGKHDILPDGKQVSWKEIATQDPEMAEQCLKTNYYGAKAVVEAFIPLLQLSDSPRIVNVSSLLGMFQFLPNEWAKSVLSDVENLTEDTIDGVIKQFLEDYKNGLLETNSWPAQTSGYIVSKVAMNAYTRILARKYPNIIVNAIGPGFCKTDITLNFGRLSATEGAENCVRLALLPNDGPSGCFFNMKELSCF